MKCQCVAQVRSFDQENPLFQFELGGENEIHNYRIACPPDPERPARELGRNCKRGLPDLALGVAGTASAGRDGR